MIFNNDPNMRRWTEAAIYCYERKFNCKGCHFSEMMESKCQMRDTVMALYRKFGKPNTKEGRFMIKKQLSIINHYGVENQKKKLIEELDELKEALLENNDEMHVIEEMADVLNVMQQIIYKMDYETQILEMQEYKLDRQIKRIYRENRKEKIDGKMD